MYGAGVEMARLDVLVQEQTGPATFGSMAAAVAVDVAQAGNAAGSVSSFGAGGLVGTSPAISTSTKLFVQGTDPRTLDQQIGLPLLDSNPGAPATLYLDFNGNFERDWWYLENGQEVHFRNITTPVFDTDNNPNSFGADEQNLIKEIWSRVVEDYAPFNINISTDYYSSFNNAQALHVVIGGNNSDWLKSDSSGISSIGSFSDSAPNEVFVFDLMAWAKAGVKDSDGQVLNGAAAIATTVSHEAGHTFGLRHQALYKVDGTKITDYDPGTLGWTPIMGDNKASDRTTWNYGPTDQSTLQIDMDVIARSANGFGYQADDHGSTLATADLLTNNFAVGPLRGRGVINTMTDVDAFKFTSGGGQFQVKVDAVKYGPNLIPVAELWSTSGFVARANAGSLTQSIIDANVPAGTYFVLVKSFGDYGDVGQYSVSVSFGSVLTQYSSVLAVSNLGSPTQTSAISTVSAVTTGLESTAMKGSTSLGAGQGAAPVDLSSENNRAVPALSSNVKTAGGKTAAALHDLVFELGEFNDELDALPQMGPGRSHSARV